MLSTIIYSGLLSNSFITMITLPNREWTQIERLSFAFFRVHSRFFILPPGRPRSGLKAASAGPTQEPRSFAVGKS